jgi:alpha-acetolactate decarboxylase
MHDAACAAVAVAAAGSFSYVKSRSVCKQEGRVRLKDVAASQVRQRCWTSCMVEQT